MSIRSLPPHILAQAISVSSPSAVYSPNSGDVATTAVQNNSGTYRIVYTANTGCFGGDGVSGRHDLNNMRNLSERVEINYINTNFQSEQVGDEWAAAITPRDAQGNPVPGTKIATVAQGGNSKSEATQLGKALLEHYQLSAFKPNVVLVFVTDPNDRLKDRIVRNFPTTFDANFVSEVENAILTDREMQQQNRTGVQRNK